VINAAERQRKLESYGNAYAVLIEAIKQFPKEMWHFKPKDGWSIHAILVHITDSEANSFVRCRRAIAEPGSVVMGYNESQWAVALHYENQSAEDALELFRWLRHNSYMLIKDQPESVWANTIDHSESGRMTLDDWLDVYDRHITDHIAQMRCVYDEWRQSS